MFNKLDLSFEIKSMGASFYVAFIGFIVLLYQMLTYNGADFVFFRVLEFLICPLAGWWSIYLFYDYFEDRAEELLFSYPVTRWQHGAVRVLTFLSLYIFMVLIGLLILNQSILYASYLDLIVPYASLSLFFGTLSFLLVVLFRKVMVAIIIITVYTTTEYLTNGEILPWYHAMFFHDSLVGVQETAMKSGINVLLAMVFVLIAQMVLYKRKPI